MTNLTVEFKGLLAKSVQELSDILETKDFEATIAASEEITACLKECLKLCSNSEKIVTKIQDFAEEEMENASKPAVDNTIIDDASLEALFKKVNPSFGADLQLDDKEKKGVSGILKNWYHAGMKRK